MSTKRGVSRKKDGNKNPMKGLKDLKELNPIELAEAVIVNKLQSELRACATKEGFNKK